MLTAMKQLVALPVIRKMTAAILVVVADHLRALARNRP